MRSSLFFTIVFAALFALISAKKHHHKHHHHVRAHHKTHHHHKSTKGKGTGVIALGETFHGEATYFYQYGVAGSCGTVHSDSVPLVALNEGQVSNGAHCGQYVHITNVDNGKSVTALVADTCPGCHAQSLDLSTGAFDAIGPESQGVLNIVWSFV